jgi:hypothetical protein
MSNFIFLSSMPGLIIENLKLTAKFTSPDLTKSDWIFRVIVRTPDEKHIHKKPTFLYLLIKQTIKEDITVDRIIDTEQHKLLRDTGYLEYLGKAFVLGEEPGILKIHEKYEIEALRNEWMINPEDVKVSVEIPPKSSLNEENLGKSSVLTEKDIGFRICLNNQELEGNKLYVVQFTLVLNNFIPQDTLQTMKERGSGWSLGINLDNRFEHTETFLSLSKWICDIKSFELWVGMPHRHMILDSSPKYSALYSFGPWDTDRMKEFETRYEALQKTKEFESTVGDIWLKIVEDVHGDEQERRRVEGVFTIIGFSPWIGEAFQEVAKELEEKTRNFVRKGELQTELQKVEKALYDRDLEIEKRYISYKDAFQAWGLFAAMLTVVLTVIVLVIKDISGVTIVVPEIRQLTLREAVEMGAVIGVVSVVFYHIILFILKRIGLVRDKPREVRK